MGGFLGIGGSSAKTDRNQTLNSYQNLNSLFNFGFGTGQSMTAAGTAKQNAGAGSLDAASGYFAKLASGNRPAMMSAIAPTANAIQSSGDAARRQSASMGTSRGGGVAGANQQQETDQMTQINNALFGVQPQAAAEQAQIGTQQAAVGTQQVGEGLNFGGLAENAAGADLSGSITSRPISQKINQDTVASIADFAGGMIDAIPGMPKWLKAMPL